MPLRGLPFALLPLLAALALAGCVEEAASAVEPAAGTEEAPTDRARTVVTLEAQERILLAATDACTPPPCGSVAWEPEPALLELPRPGPIRAIFTAEWSPTTPTAERLSVALATDGGHVVAEVQGPSPLVLNLTGEDLPGLSYSTRARPAGPGVAFEQDVSYTLVVEYAS